MASARTVRLLLTGDVMLGRGVDQILPHHCKPAIYEEAVQDARVYVRLAEAANGPLPPAAQRGAAYPWGTALQDMQEKRPNVCLVNLETALTTCDTPWPNKGINYRTHPGNVATLKAAGVQAVSLANNHVEDWVEQGLLETLDTLQAAGIQTAGAGRDADEAHAPAVLGMPSAAGGGRVLVWGLGHGSSGVPPAWRAGPARPGVWVAELSARGVAEVAAQVGRHKRPGDVAVASIHWGANWGFEVPEEQRAFARALIDSAGVDLVHGHSSHHAKGAEVYRGKLIIYGAGDLISDYEGITNPGVQSIYPPDAFRDDVGLLWYADVRPADGSLARLTMHPTRLRKLSLGPLDAADWRYIAGTMDRECRRLCGLRVRRVRDDLQLQLPGGAEL